MSITDDQNEIVKLGTVHAAVFKVSLWLAPIFSIWLTNKVIEHDTEIALLKMEMAMNRGKSAMSQSVKIGGTESECDDQSRKTWLTTQQVAEREKVTERTILNYIEAGTIEPAPVKAGKEWQISADYRIIPKNAATVSSLKPET